MMRLQQLAGNDANDLPEVQKLLFEVQMAAMSCQTPHAARWKGFLMRLEEVDALLLMIMANLLDDKVLQTDLEEWEDLMDIDMIALIHFLYRIKVSRCD